jgi:cytidylate kinase
MKYFIIFGPPGAGKGKQSSLLIERYSLRHVSTGQLLREEIAKGTEVGRVAKELIDQGKFVDDNIVLDIIDESSFLPSISALLRILSTITLSSTSSDKTAVTPVLLNLRSILSSASA